jgi:hypothetical protein
MSIKKTNQAVLTACYEYLLVTVPVGLYVALEAKHAGNVSLFVTSPEWAVATIFLLFQGISLYFRHLNSTGARVSAINLSLLCLISLVIMTITVVNAYTSLDEPENTGGAIGIRSLMFVSVSAAFLIMVSGSKLYLLRREEKRGG